MLPYIVTILGAYLIGCSNMALYLSRWKGVDLRAGGSKNLGASNAFALMGWKAGLLVAVHDIGKAVLAVELSKWIFPAVPLLGFIAGVACVLGHMFPIFYDFHGGKGLAALGGTILAIDPHLAIFLGIIAATLIVVTHYGIAAAVSVSILFPVFLQLRTGDWFAFLLTMSVSLIMLYKHMPNFKRIAEGTEVRFFVKDKAE